MKTEKRISILLIITCIFFMNQGIIQVNAKEINSSSHYTITPKSDSWKDFSSVELKKMLNISREEAEHMDTETLLDVVLNYPFLGDIYAFEDQDKALDYLAEQFTALKVLLERNDITDKLVQNYNISISERMFLRSDSNLDFEERYKHKYRESLLAYSNVYEKLSIKQKDEIVKSSNKIASLINTNSISLEQPSKFSEVASRVSPGDIIRIGSVSTPKRSSVTVYEIQEMTQSDKNTADAYIASRYPNAIKIRSASFKYNCHSYAWYSTSSANSWWMDDPGKYMNDGSYTRSNSPAKYQKVYYPNPGNEHSGEITAISGSNITVTSKWGSYGLYRHAEMDCPYFSMYLNTYWSMNSPW